MPAPYAGTNTLLAGLDEEQRTAAEYLDGPLLIIAGPGTGKTRTVTHRIAHLITVCAVPPEACLALTFTRRAASEMTERLQPLMPDLADRVPVMTFHSLGLMILRELADQAALPTTFAVAGDTEREALLSSVLGSGSRKTRRYLDRIATCKREGQSPGTDSDLANVFERYQAALRERALVDFEDLFALPLDILENDQATRRRYHERFRWITIDEYQDIDALQYRLVRTLAPPNANLCAIGDPNQAIYSFRGADVAFFQRFEKDYPQARVVRLNRSYRCTRTVLDASAQVIGGHDQTKLQALLESPHRIVMHEAPTERAEAEFVVHSIEQLLGGHTFFSLDSGRTDQDASMDLTFGDIAILYRLDAQADALCEALARSGIPYEKRSHRRLADQPLVQHLVSIIRAAPRTRDLREALRSAAESLLANDPTDLPGVDPAPDAEEPNDPATAINAAVALIEPLAAQCGSDTARFLDGLALGTELDSWDPRAERVSLLTLHAAKGLEFPVIFMVGCEDGLLPLRWGPTIDPAALEEERRLFYVGMTRTRLQLFLCHATKRRRHGKLRQMTPSPFLHEIQQHLLEHRATTAKPRPKPTPTPQMDLFT